MHSTNIVDTLIKDIEERLTKQILKHMEEVNPPEIRVVKSERKRKGGYPKGTIIRF